MLRGFFHQARLHSEALIKLPVLFAGMVVAALGFLAGAWHSSARVEISDERVSLLNDQLAAYKDRLQGATPDQAAKQITELKNQIAALSSPQWDPLTETESLELSRRLISLGSQEMVIQCGSPRGCGRLAASLEEAFRRAGWKVRQADNIAQRPGLWIVPTDDGVSALADALAAVLDKTIFVDQLNREAVDMKGYWLAIGEKSP